MRAADDGRGREALQLLLAFCCIAHAQKAVGGPTPPAHRSVIRADGPQLQTHRMSQHASAWSVALPNGRASFLPSAFALRESEHPCCACSPHCCFFMILSVRGLGDEQEKKTSRNQREMASDSAGRPECGVVIHSLSV